MASFACSCRFLFIADLNLRGHRSGETVRLILCTRSPLDWRVSPILEAIVVRRTRQGNTGSQCQLRMVVRQLSGQTFDDSGQILQVCCEPTKVTRRRQETNNSDTCPFSQFIVNKTSTRVRNQELQLWVMLHPITCEM